MSGQTVYIVKGVVEYEGSDLLAGFSTEPAADEYVRSRHAADRKAQQKAKAENKGWWGYDFYSVTPLELDKPEVIS